MGRNDLVSVILPAYNAEPYIEQAISSVLQQTYPNFELIVVYDRSKDRTLEVIESFSDPRLRILKQDTNRGPGVARNAALDVARGKWVTFIDADDAWLPERLEALVPLAEEAGSSFFLADDLLLCFDTPSGLRPWKSQFKEYGIEFDGLTYDMDLVHFFGIGCPVIKPLIPLEHVRSLSIRFSDSRYGEDLEFWCDLFRTGLRLRLVRKAFYLYRLTPNSLTSNVNNIKDFFEVYKRLLARDGFTEEERNLFRENLYIATHKYKYASFTACIKRKDFIGAKQHVSRQPSLLLQLCMNFPKSFRYRLSAMFYKGRIK